MSSNRISKIVSGGQTGADRAALDFAIEQGVPHGGWCPKGRLAEDGAIDPRYQLKERPSSNYVQRTEWNARDSDGTVVFSIDPVLTGGSKKTVLLAHRLGKPVLRISRDGGPSHRSRSCGDSSRPITPRPHLANWTPGSASGLT